MTNRIIFCIYIQFEPWPEARPEETGPGLIVWLSRSGQSLRCGSEGLPPHRARYIDLRAGDEVQLPSGRYGKIKEITAHRDNWITEEYAATIPEDGG